MVREISESAVSRPKRSLIPFAMIGAIALALPLTACGRKGALDPPPGGYALERSTLNTPVSDKGAAMAPPPKQPEYDEEGKPIAPQGPNKRLPGDWLLD
jgi:hypothetical protein